MSIYIYSLAAYVIGFIVMFALLVRGDKVCDLEFDLADTLFTSFLWPFYVVAILLIEVYEFFQRPKSR
ncbi:oxidoreductase [Citrobacter youngae]|nr:oxidoreductase [Citrobacter youngae]